MMKRSRRFSHPAWLPVGILLCFLVFLPSFSTVPDTLSLAFDIADAQQIPYVILDPGHGGSDPGAPNADLAPLCGVPLDFREKDATLGVALQVRDILQANGVQVGMTRETDVFPTLTERTDFINNELPDLAISIHANSGTLEPLSCGDGVEGFYSSTGPGGSAKPEAVVESSRQLAERLVLKINQAFGLRIRPTPPDVMGGLQLVRVPVVPSALIEMAFMSNPDERLLLRDHSAGFAQAIADAIIEQLVAQGFALGAPDADLAIAMDIPPELILDATLGTSDPEGAGVFNTPVSSFPRFGDSFAAISSGHVADATRPNDSPDWSSELAGLSTNQGEVSGSALVDFGGAAKRKLLGGGLQVLLRGVP